VAKALVLEAVVEEHNVGVEMPQRVQPAFDPVLIDEDTDSGEISRQHMRFVASTP